MCTFSGTMLVGRHNLHNKFWYPWMPTMSLFALSGQPWSSMSLPIKDKIFLTSYCAIAPLSHADEVAVQSVLVLPSPDSTAVPSSAAASSSSSAGQMVLRLSKPQLPAWLQSTDGRQFVQMLAEAQPPLPQPLQHVLAQLSRCAAEESVTLSGQELLDANVAAHGACGLPPNARLHLSRSGKMLVDRGAHSRAFMLGEEWRRSVLVLVLGPSHSLDSPIHTFLHDSKAGRVAPVKDFPGLLCKHQVCTAVPLHLAYHPG